MATNYPTFQSDPILNSVTASTGVSGAVGTFSNITASNISGTNNLIVGGNLALGVTNAVGKLNVDVATLANTTDTLQRWSWNTSNVWGLDLDQVHAGSRIDYAFRTKNNSVTDVEAIYLKSDGNIGIGITAPNYKLDVSGTGRFTSNVEVTGTLTATSNITSSGDMLVNGLWIGRGRLSNNNTTVAFGFDALSSSVGSTSNTAIGNTALKNTTGFGNTALGSLALTANTTGQTNLAVGLNSLNSNTTGSNNIGIGISALRYIVSGSNNLALGYNAGGSISLTSLANSVIIGGNNGSTLNGLTGSIIISDGIGNIRIQADNTGLVTIPGSLTVTGNVIFGDASTDIVTSTAQLTASNGISSSLGLFTALSASNISSSSNLFVGGNINLSNAGGIVFGSSYAGPTGSSTTLDDYEVGTWTPALSSSAVFTSTAPLSTTRGTYVKIGKKVFVQCTINLTSPGTGSATGQVFLTGLPFTAHTYQNGIISPTSWYSMNSTLTSIFVGYVLSSTSTALLIKPTAGGISSVQTTDFTNTAQLHFNGNYEIS